MAGAGAQAGIWSFGSGSDLNSILHHNSYTTGSSKWPISVFYSKNYETLLFNLEAGHTYKAEVGACYGAETLKVG
jgi:hypothetical protein